MKKILSFITILLFVGLFSVSPIHADQEYDFSYYDLYFKTMDVTIDIEEDGLYTVTTKIDAYFNQSGRGIEVWLPNRYTMDFEVDDVNYSRRYYWDVENINVKNNEYTTFNEDIFSVIRIGNPNVYVSEDQSYEYSYQVQTDSLRVEDLSLLYWNILGADWPVPTQNLTFTINLPKAVDEQPTFFSGVYGSSDSDKIAFEFDQTTITGYSTQPLQPKEAVTISMTLPTDYFDFKPLPNYVPVAIGLSLVLVALSIYLFIRYGKDYPVIQTIEIDAPDGYSSAMVGYAYDNQADNKDILSLIVQWASQGLIAIKELESDTMELSKLKEINASAIDYEIRLFNDLFKSGDIVTTNELKDTFHKKIEKAKLGLSHLFKRKNYRLFYAKSSAYQWLLILLAPFILALYVGLAIYSSTGQLFFFSVSFAITAFIAIIFAIVFVLSFTNFNIRSKASRVLTLILIAIITIVAIAILIFILNYFIAFYNNLFIVVAAFLIVLLFASNMSKRTRYGSEILGKILGLKTFIREAELDELEMLVHDDPVFFYRILPFAYVLGLSDTWSKKFESLAVPPPEWYSGTNPDFSTVIFMTRMNHMMSVTQTAMTSIPIDIKSGSGGGTFGSGGGGGGFSGGGFGGGGGGGW